MRKVDRFRRTEKGTESGDDNEETSSSKTKEGRCRVGEVNDERSEETRKTKSREPAKAKSKPKKSAKSGSGDGEADSDAPLGNQPSDANEDDIHDATEEDINNFKPGQTKPTPSPVSSESRCND